VGGGGGEEAWEWSLVWVWLGADIHGGGGLSWFCQL
jgi:hypothetical protein